MNTLLHVALRYLRAAAHDQLDHEHVEGGGVGVLDGLLQLAFQLRQLV